MTVPPSRATRISARRAALKGHLSMDTDCTLDSCPAYGLGRKALIVYLAFLSAFTPLSTDLFLPALPIMAEYFQATPGLTNLTLMGFMFFFALSMLVWGPLSDKYGRRPVILAGLTLYLLSSVMCALSSDIWMLIGGRVIQATGSGAVSAVAMAITKDVFRGRTMENVLTTIQTMMLIAPMIAPVLGGFLLALSSWRGIFWAFVICGVVAWLGLLPLRESLERPTEGPALKSLGRIAFVLGHGRFSALLAVFSVASMPIMVFLATSAYVYQRSFGVSPQMYSAFFCANALASVLGPYTLPPRTARTAAAGSDHRLFRRSRGRLRAAAPVRSCRAFLVRGPHAARHLLLHRDPAAFNHHSHDHA